MEALSSKEACPFCQQLIDRNLINDHTMCHQVENEEEFINNSSQNRDINSNNISNNNNINNNPNNDDTAKLNEI